MDSKDWEAVGQMQMSIAEFIENNSGNARATYAAAEDAFWRALTTCPKDACQDEKQRLCDLQQKAFMATKRG